MSAKQLERVRLGEELDPFDAGDRLHDELARFVFFLDRDGLELDLLHGGELVGCQVGPGARRRVPFAIVAMTRAFAVAGQPFAIVAKVVPHT